MPTPTDPRTATHTQAHPDTKCARCGHPYKDHDPDEKRRIPLTGMRACEDFYGHTPRLEGPETDLTLPLDLPPCWTQTDDLGDGWGRLFERKVFHGSQSFTVERVVNGGHWYVFHTTNLRGCPSRDCLVGPLRTPREAITQANRFARLNFEAMVGPTATTEGA